MGQPCRTLPLRGGRGAPEGGVPQTCQVGWHHSKTRVSEAELFLLTPNAPSDQFPA